MRKPFVFRVDDLNRPWVVTNAPGVYMHFPTWRDAIAYALRLAESVSQP